MRLKVYTVHDRPSGLGLGGDEVFVPERFSLLAFVLLPLWFFFHGLWREGALVLGAVIALPAILAGLEQGQALGVGFNLLLALTVGLFAQDWRRRALARRGYETAGVIAGHSLREAEYRYFAASAATSGGRASTAGTKVETVVVIDHGSGNLRSVAKAFEHAAGQIENGPNIVVSADPSALGAADRIVLPGVGAFADCMNGLAGVPGLTDALTQAVQRDKKPFLGICVGMQLMAETGLEHGEHKGLGWIAGSVEPLTPTDASLRIPHMGWNELQFSEAGCAHPVLAGLEDGDHAYFVHSFGFRPREPRDVLASADYGGEVVAIIGRDNIVGVQFHPEKSQAVGLRLIENFLRWQP